MTASTVFVGSQAIRLGKRIGKGGEGEVYAIENRGDQALKLYTVAKPGDRAAKIEAMVRAGLAAQSRLVSYPSAIVNDSGGNFAGFLMRLFSDHQPVHHLYAPGDRKLYFPNADYRFLIRTALNLARALAEVHAQNCVIGDINHSGILVSDQAIVALIDADSFQITDGDREYLCPVGVPEYTPPELQGDSLSGVRRTQNHDAFGLAVMIFQLLCMGRHPYVGAFARGEMPMEKAIAQHRFAYSARRSVGMKPPPGSATLADLPPAIATAFEAAFDPTAQRPTAANWVLLLGNLEQQLTRCAASDLHYYPSAAAECPWCRMERTVGIVLFLSGISSAKTTTPAALLTFDLEAAWAAIETVQLPPVEAPDPVLPDVSLRPSHEAMSVAARARNRRAINGALVCGGLFGIAFAPSLDVLWILVGGLNVLHIFLPTRAGAKLRKHLKEWNRRWDAAVADWIRRCGGPEVHAHKQKLAEARKQLQTLPTDLRNRLASHDANRRYSQLRSHMENHRIGTAAISDVGDTLKMALASYGISNAQEVSYQRVVAVGGFGPAKAKAMTEWRRQVAARFVFDSSPNAVDAREKDKIDREFANKGDQLRVSLAAGARELNVASQNVLARWATADKALIQIYRDRIQAEVDDVFVNAPLLLQLQDMGVIGWIVVVFAIIGIIAIIGSGVGRDLYFS